MTKIFFPLAAALALTGAPAAAQSVEEPAAEEARIPFLHIGRMRSFRAIDQNTLYVRVSRREWYRVTTLGPCPSLPWAHYIGVDTHGASAFDRFSTLVVEGERCPVASVVRSGPPPSRDDD
ncbi:MAG: DUF6491 family protein [Pseudomonadota bacterium]|nr:DUF6491 family protein [Pseudomonadota bacterium]